MDDGTATYAREAARRAAEAGDGHSEAHWTREAHRRRGQDAATGLPTYSAALRRFGLM
jgi:hypothetical protein